MTRREPRTRGLPGVVALLLASMTACPAQRPARHTAPAQHAAQAQPDSRSERVVVVVAVAELAGDRDHLLEQRVLAHLRAFGPGPDAPAGAFELEVIDLPRAVLAPDAGAARSPLDVLQEGHARARALLAESGAGALIWGTAGPDGAPVLYVTTAESSRWPCERDLDQASGDAPAATGHVLCALDTGATWLLCATAWARIVPLGCAP